MHAPPVRIGNRLFEGSTQIHQGIVPGTGIFPEQCPFYYREDLCVVHRSCIGKEEMDEDPADICLDEEIRLKKSDGEVKAEIEELMAGDPRIAKHVHAPLQSGSDTVLRRMHRKLVVIDGEIAFVGGINLIDDMRLNFHTLPEEVLWME